MPEGGTYLDQRVRPTALVQPPCRKAGRIWTTTDSDNASFNCGVREPPFRDVQTDFFDPYVVNSRTGEGARLLGGTLGDCLDVSVLTPEVEAAARAVLASP